MNLVMSTTLQDFLAESCKSDKQYKNLGKVVLAIAKVVCETQNTLKTAQFISGNDLSPDKKLLQTVSTTVSDAFVTKIMKCGCVRAIGCEEVNSLTKISQYSKYSYIIQMRQLNDLSNIDVDFGFGSIFGIWPNRENESGHDANFSQGIEQVAALYAIYGLSTTLVVALKNTVHAFSLNPYSNLFEMTHTNIRIPETGQFYSVNESYFHTFDTQTQKAVAHLRNHYALRYTGSLVMDFHYNLFKGGVLIFPKDCLNPRGNLHLMYEANPLSFIAEQAGGAASSGTENILEIMPDNQHQLTPMIIGAKSLVSQITDLMR